MNFELLRATSFQRIGVSFATTFGLIWLVLEPVGLFFPDFPALGWWGYSLLVVVSLVVAVARNRPQSSICRSLSSPDSTIEVKVGDLFDEHCHLVIGVNDVFDTELGEIIRSDSVQAKFLMRIYGGDKIRLDADIEAALQLIQHQGVDDPGKVRGKRRRYPVGTAIVLGDTKRRYFLSAYGKMGNDLRVQSTADDIWKSLSALWEQVRLKGHGLEVAIPVVGSDLARTGLPRMTLIKLIVISFIAASKKEYITKKLTIVVYSKDVATVDMPALEDFLESTCF